MEAEDTSVIVSSPKKIVSPQPKRTTKTVKNVSFMGQSTPPSERRKIVLNERKEHIIKGRLLSKGMLQGQMNMHPKMANILHGDETIAENTLMMDNWRNLMGTLREINGNEDELQLDDFIEALRTEEEEVLRIEEEVRLIEEENEKMEEEISDEEWEERQKERAETDEEWEKESQGGEDKKESRTDSGEQSVISWIEEDVIKLEEEIKQIEEEQRVIEEENKAIEKELSELNIEGEKGKETTEMSKCREEDSNDEGKSRTGELGKGDHHEVDGFFESAEEERRRKEEENDTLKIRNTRPSSKMALSSPSSSGHSRARKGSLERRHTRSLSDSESHQIGCILDSISLARKHRGGDAHQAAATCAESSEGESEASTVAGINSNNKRIGQLYSCNGMGKGLMDGGLDLQQLLQSSGGKLGIGRNGARRLRRGGRDLSISSSSSSSSYLDAQTSSSSSTTIRRSLSDLLDYSDIDTSESSDEGSDDGEAADAEEEEEDSVRLMMMMRAKKKNRDDHEHEGSSPLRAAAMEISVT